MKKFISTIFAAAALLGAVSCSDFLTTNPSSSVSDNSVFLTAQGAQGALNGCYNLISFGNWGGRADTEGYMSQILTFDVDGEDIIVSGGWYGYDYNMWGHQRGDIFKSYGLWAYYYSIINNLNSIITYTPEINASESVLNAIVGQALAIRGWCYFNLIQLFQQTYSVASPRNMPGVPIYTEPTTDATVGNGRGTINDTYDQILSDLTTAEKLLEGFNRTAKNHFDQSVVRGLLARVYLVMNKWSEASDYAAKARASYPLTSNEDYNSGFNEINTKSWMWGMRVDSEHTLQANGDYSTFAMWANWVTRGADNGNGGWSFNCFFLNDKFVELFDDQDIRGKQIFDPNIYGTYPPYASKKIYDKPDLTGDFVFMRADEMLLIQAEAQAQLGNEGVALDLLHELQNLREVKNPTQATGGDLLEQIYIERRKELYGEGFAWYDIIRQKKGLTREGAHADYDGHKVLPPLSWRFVYQIPQSEMLNNPNLDEGIWPNGDQNPFGDFNLCLE